MLRTLRREKNINISGAKFRATTTAGHFPSRMLKDKKEFPYKGSIRNMLKHRGSDTE
jgi:hypothetical protein